MTERVLSRVRDNLHVLRERPATLILAMLLTTDVVFLALHVLHAFVGQPAHWAFDLGADRSYGEIVLYLKWVWIAVLCLVAWRSRHATILLSIVATCAILLVEDGLFVHERIGWALEPILTDIAPSVNPLVWMQVGELAWLCVLVAVLVATFVVGWIRSTRESRIDAATIALFFLAFAFFSVVIDSAHAFVAPGTIADGVLTLIEDGGELVSMTPAVALAFTWAAEPRVRDDAP